ncbi:MAG: hypothetical protein ACK5QU_04565 [Bacteroidota bacterium]
MKKMFKTLMIVWLIAAVAALLAAIVSAVNNKFPETFIFLAITVIGAVMFVINKKRIEHMSTQDAQQPSNPT